MTFYDDENKVKNHYDKPHKRLHAKTILKKIFWKYISSQNIALCVNNFMEIYLCDLGFQDIDHCRL